MEHQGRDHALVADPQDGTAEDGPESSRRMASDGDQFVVSFVNRVRTGWSRRQAIRIAIFRLPATSRSQSTVVIAGFREPCGSSIGQ